LFHGTDATRYAAERPLFAIHRRSRPPGPVGTWLIDRLAEGAVF
jgi:hypothetical protein